MAIKPKPGKPKKKSGKAPKGGSSTRRAKKATKAESVEVNGAQGLLLGNMPPIKDLKYHLGQIKGFQDAAKTASGRVTAAKKAAKEAGVDLQAIALAMGFKRADALDLATMLRQLQALMAEEGTPVQISLFEPKYGSVEKQAAHEGWKDGKAGKSPDTVRWPEGTPGHVEYLRRWNDAQRDTIEGDAGGQDQD